MALTGLATGLYARATSRPLSAPVVATALVGIAVSVAQNGFHWVPTTLLASVSVLGAGVVLRASEPASEGGP